MTDWLAETTGLSAEASLRLLSTVLVIAALMAVRSLTLSLLKRRGIEASVRYRWRRISAYVVGSLSLLITASIWLRGLEAMATFAGLLSAGLAISLKDVATNLAGWVFILWRRPFELGDRIDIDGDRGDVVDIRIFQHSLMEIGNWIDADDRTGRILHVPNSKVFTATIANYTKGWFEQIWHEIPVVLTFESNWRDARKILQVIIDASSIGGGSSQQTSAPNATAHYLVLDASIQPTVFMCVVDSGVKLTLRYCCDPRKRRSTEQAIWEAILDAFDRRDDIDFAYPTQRFYDNASEGKRALRPKP
ncbi:MAG: mechanosensitive ion channel family protein [Myxococcales bacterium]|nr:mechanosensitive ion channel family protein [Myxococcales bacterium]